MSGKSVGSPTPPELDDLWDRWQSAWGSREQDRFAACCRPNVHYEDPATAEPLQGATEIGAHAQRLWDAFPDLRLERSGDRLGNERYAVAPCRLLGTHKGDIGEGLPATGRFVTLHCLFYAELENGLLLRVRTFIDVYDAARQLGVLPQRGSLGEKALLMLRGFGLRSRSDE